MLIEKENDVELKLNIQQGNKTESKSISRANEEQYQAITTTEGPVLIIAGPGTGKTFTLVQRTIYLIKEKNVKPNQIMIATFTDKAANELITRISNELSSHNLQININDMYIGTFHSICLKLIKTYIDYTQVKKNYVLLDSFGQQYFIYQKIEWFNQIEGYCEVIKSKNRWEEAKAISSLVNYLTEELISQEKLESSSDSKEKICAKILKTYKQLLKDGNYLDFSSIQFEAYWLLKSHPEICRAIQTQLQYIMVDEYQDTNYIQEQLVFTLANEKNNICVVGDDDQGLYRFRGATIRNILEFPCKFKEGMCKRVTLNKNYRSNKGIIDFYNQWMKTTYFDSAHYYTWGQFRYSKEIQPFKDANIHSKTVLKITANNNLEEWFQRNLEFVKKLKETNRIKDYNQIAYLFKSVKNENVIALARYFENHGINVYSPRSNMFFLRDEVKLIVGSILLCFSIFLDKIKNGIVKISKELKDYYLESINCIENEKYGLLKKKIEELSTIANNNKDKSKVLSNLFYQLLAVDPFASIIKLVQDSKSVDTRSIRNLSLFSNILSNFENTIRNNEKEDKTDLPFNFFAQYLTKIYENVSEYEDPVEYAPSGSISFLTIHQSKGMEFPIVVVGSLSNIAKTQKESYTSIISENLLNRAPFEPSEGIKYYDFMRLYYTAFSRAQNLLVLTANQTEKSEPSLFFRGTYNSLLEFDNPNITFEDFCIEEIKKPDLQSIFSLTHDLSLFEECSLLYKMNREFGFAPSRLGSDMFGILVHDTIEDIHRAVLNKKTESITPENIEVWLKSNYHNLKKIKHIQLDLYELENAKKQVMTYVNRQNGDWSHIKASEIEISYNGPNYIINGSIDLMASKNGNNEILDFKTGKRPAGSEEQRYYDLYKNQLQIYAMVMQKTYKMRVDTLTLFFTGETERDPWVSFSYDSSKDADSLKAFGVIIEAIQKKECTNYSQNPKLCNSCDFNYYCKAQNVKLIEIIRKE